jgi:hypothetical protein
MEAAEVETTLGFLRGNAERVHEEQKTLLFSLFIYFWTELPSDAAILDMAHFSSPLHATMTHKHDMNQRFLKFNFFYLKPLT